MFAPPPPILLFTEQRQKRSNRNALKKQATGANPCWSGFYCWEPKNVGDGSGKYMLWKHAQPCQVSTQRVFSWYVIQNLLPNASAPKKIWQESSWKKTTREALSRSAACQTKLMGTWSKASLERTAHELRSLPSFGKIDSTSIVYRYI